MTGEPRPSYPNEDVAVRLYHLALMRDIREGDTDSDGSRFVQVGMVLAHLGMQPERVEAAAQSAADLLIADVDRIMGGSRRTYDE